jgi:DNA-binding MarR family transcriptional regulator
MLVRAYGALKVDTPFVRKKGLTKPRYHVLRLLHTSLEKRLLMSDIVHAMNVSPTNVTKLVDGLEKDELVRRINNPRDKRKVWVELMPAGRDAVEEAIPGVVEHITNLWSTLNPDEKKLLIHLLSKLRFGILTGGSQDQVEWMAKHPVMMPVFS